MLDDDDSSTTTRGCLHLLIDHPEAMTHVLPLLLARGARLDLQDAVRCVWGGNWNYKYM